MCSNTDLDQETCKIRKSAKRYGVVCTLVYVFFYPFLFITLPLSLRSLVDSGRPAAISWFFILGYAALFFSLPLSIYLMWSRYTQQQYKNARRFCFLPFLVFGAVFALFYVFGALFTLWEMFV